MSVASLGRIALVLALATAAARADVTAAARAFSDGQSAQLAGDYDRAAGSYELAYSISPSKEALRAAVKARMQGNQLLRAAMLAEILLANYPDDAASAKLAKDVIGKASPKLTRVALACSAPCTAGVDGKSVTMTAAATQVFYVVPGQHALDVSFDGDVGVQRKLDASAGSEIELKVEKPAPKVVEPPPPPPPNHDEHDDKHEPPPPHQDELPPPPPKHAHGLPRWVPLAGAAVTVGLAGATTWSGLDTWSAHDKYAANPTDAAYKSGQDKQTRTNLLLGATIGVGVGTALVAAFWTKWHDDEAPVQMTASAGGASASLHLRF